MKTEKENMEENDEKGHDLCDCTSHIRKETPEKTKTTIDMKEFLYSKEFKDLEIEWGKQGQIKALKKLKSNLIKFENERDVYDYIEKEFKENDE